jgi:hypothetical protein
MSQHNPKVYAALGIASLALALSIYTTVRGRSDASAPGSAACVDPDARAQVDRLRRALVERDARLAQLARAANVPGPDPAPVEAAAQPAPPADPEARRYTRFEIPNPAVTVTPKGDGTFDIRTTDPSLAGTVMQITAYTQSGDEQKVLIRIPQ